MLKAVLFDLDDTLIDWGDFNEDWDAMEYRHVVGVHRYITDHIQVICEVKDFFKEYMRRTGQAWAQARTTLTAPHVGKVLLDTASFFGVPESKLDQNAFLKAYNWRKIEHTTVFPDSIPGLKRLRDANLKLVLITNAYQPMWMRDIEMQQHGLLEFFPNCRFSAADVGKLKPHPSIFQKALTCLDVKPEETVFIGDNPTADIAGAQSAGMRAVLRVKLPMRPLISGLVIPDAAINSLDELPTILDGWFPNWSQIPDPNPNPKAL